jgi:hypothetical protein
MKEILLNALAFAWLHHEMTTEEYWDCVRQVKEKFNV